MSYDDGWDHVEVTREVAVEIISTTDSVLILNPHKWRWELEMQGLDAYVYSAPRMTTQKGRRT